MALTLLDLLSPWRRGRFDALCRTSAGDRHWYLLFVGVGWALARVPWARRDFERAVQRYDPLYGWLALDGYGFHEGFFSQRRSVEQQIVPRHLSASARQVFDQGLGRSLWFSHCGDPDRLAATVTSFPLARREDLWSGVGLAASYAGGVAPAVLARMATLARGYEPQLAQGAAFAAKARQRAGNLMPHTELACDTFCQMTAQAAAQTTDDCLQNLPLTALEHADPPYQVWRRRIHERFSGNKAHGTMTASAAVLSHPSP
jgi:hypothetical protein